jgi:hypothetical protein
MQIRDLGLQAARARHGLVVGCPNMFNMAQREDLSGKSSLAT